MGSAAQANVQRYLLGQLAQMGVAAQVWQPQPQGPADVVATLRGAHSTGALLLVAHYDTMPAALGGADNASGVATVLEVVRALQAGPPLRNDLIVLLSDGEEKGLLGARAFAAAHPAMAQVRVALNLDTASYGPIILVAAGLQEGWLVSELGRLQPMPITSSAIRTIYSLMPFDNDLSALSAHGVPGAWLTSAAPFPQEHTAQDTPSVVQPASLQAMGDMALTWARRFGSLDLAASQPPDGGVICFSLPGLLLYYPAGWALPIAGVTAALYALLVTWGVRRHGIRGRGLALAILALLAALITAPVTALLLWQALQAAWPALRPPHLFTHYAGDAEILIALCAVALIPAGALRGWLAHRALADEMALAALLPWLAAVAVSSLTLPAISYAFAWPLLSALVAVGLTWRLPRVWQHALAFLGALPAVLIWAPSLYLLYMGTALTFLPAIAAGLALLWSLAATHRCWPTS